MATMSRPRTRRASPVDFSTFRSPVGGGLVRLLLDVLASLCTAVRESLPASEATAGVWLAGFAWAFALHWTLLILVTYLWSVAR